MIEVALKVLYLFISGLVVRLVYGIFIAHHEPVLRGHLSRISSERARKKYIRAFVAAMRGRADRTDATIKTYFIAFLATFVTVSCAATAIYAFRVVESARGTLVEIGKQESELSKLGDTIEQSINRNAEMRTRLAGAGKDPPAVPPRTLADETADKLAAQKEELGKLRLDLKDRRIRITVAVEEAKYARLFSVVITLFLAALALYLVMIWAPTMYATRVFAFELTRFMNRIQSIATPGEVGELACAEVLVTDEKSLRKFVELAGAVARAHGVEMLAQRFDIWDVVTLRENQERSVA